MTAKQDRRARKKAKGGVRVRCDECGRVQRNRWDDTTDRPVGCVRCGHHYGTYATA